ncbi:MAG: hypothetical protein KBS64_01040 [Treponema sp.]|nr:hypothetical protein [Candidatus Treponema equi]
MKKFKILTPAILLSAALAIFSGCSMLSDASVDNGAPKAPDVSSRSISGLVENYSEHFKADETRTILPDAFNINDTGLHFYLYGEATNGQKTGSDPANNKNLIEIEQADIDPTSGAFTMELDPYNWSLTLFVSKETGQDNFATAFTKALLVARAHVDLTSYSSAAKFYLTSVGLTGNGTVKGDITLDGWTLPDGSTIQAGLYNLVSGEALSGKLFPASPQSASGFTTAGKIEFGGESGASVPAGIYDFAVTITLANGKKFIYSDALVVVPGKETDCTVAVPAIIDVVPDAPVKFYASWDSTTVDAPNYAPDSFSCVFTWEDKSINEAGFRIQIQEVLEDATDIVGSGTTGAATWNTGSTAVYYDSEVFKDELYYVDGSLMRNNECVVLRLPLGHKYSARIWAVNDAGVSAPLTCVIADPTTNTVADARLSKSKVTAANLAYFYGWDAVDGNFKTGEQKDGSDATLSDCLGLTRFTYHVQGGSWATALAAAITDSPLTYEKKVAAIKANVAGDKYDKVNINKVVYFAQSTTAIAGLATGAPLWKFADNALQKNGLPITSWNQDTVNGTSRVPDGGFKGDGTPWVYNDKSNDGTVVLTASNVDWWANYNQQATMELEDKTILEPAAVWFEAEDAAATPNTYVVSVSKFDPVSFATAKNTLKFSVTVPNNDKKLCEKLGGTWDASTSTGSGGKFDSIKLELFNGEYPIFSETKTGTAIEDLDTATVFTWNNIDTGTFQVKFTFKKGTEMRTKALLLTVTD